MLECRARAQVINGKTSYPIASADKWNTWRLMWKKKRYRTEIRNYALICGTRLRKFVTCFLATKDGKSVVGREPLHTFIKSAGISILFY